MTGKHLSDREYWAGCVSLLREAAGPLKRAGYSELLERVEEAIDDWDGRLKALDSARAYSSGYRAGWNDALDEAHRMKKV